MSGGGGGGGGGGGAAKKVAFNFDFPVGGRGHVNIVDYSHKGTASILFDFPKCRWRLGGGGKALQTPFTNFLNFLSFFFSISVFKLWTQHVFIKQSLLNNIYKIAFIHLFCVLYMYF